MAYQYVDLNTGSLIFLNDRIVEGLNTDVNGKDYHFAAQGYLYVDPSGPVVNGYLALLNEGAMVGRDLTVTNVRTGARYSIDPGTGSIAANTPDEFIENGLYCYGAMNGATNLCAADPENFPNSTRVTKVDGLVTETTATGGHYIFGTFASTASKTTFTGEFKPNGRSWTRLDFVNGSEYLFINVETGLIGDQVGGYVQDDIDWLDLGDGYYRVSVTGKTTSNITIIWLSPDGTTATASYTGDGSSGMYMRRLRNIESTVAHAAFPDGSAAGATYGTDLPKCTPSYAAQGTIVRFSAFYGQDSNEYDLTGGAFLFATSSNSFAQFIIPATGLRQQVNVQTQTLTTDVLAEATVSVGTATWNGATETGRHNKDTALNYAQALTPSGDLYLGNASTGARIGHCLVGALIFDRELSIAEQNILVDGIPSRLAAFIAGGFR